MQTLQVAVDDLLRDGRVRVDADACPVLVALVEGRPYAVQDACRHRQASLLTGVLRDGVVTCPSHFWQYDVRTGARHDTEGEGLPSYPARLVAADGSPADTLDDAAAVEVDVPNAAPAQSLREILLAHARATRPTP
jgi:nitrite reductase/ring-hydroxylating ferredoxin subunit